MAVQVVDGTLVGVQDAVHGLGIQAVPHASTGACDQAFGLELVRI